MTQNRHDNGPATEQDVTRNTLTFEVPETVGPDGIECVCGHVSDGWDADRAHGAECREFQRKIIPALIQRWGRKRVSQLYGEDALPKADPWRL